MKLSVPAEQSEQWQHLFLTLGRAQDNFEIWEGLQEARTSEATVKVMNRYPDFFNTIQHALFSSFVLLLYRAHEKRNDTINFPGLLNGLPHRNSSEIKRLEEELAKMKPIWVKIGILRNEVIAHQSAQSSIVDSFEKARISVKEIENFLSDSKQLLTRLSGRELMFGTSEKDSVHRMLNDLATER
jgi:hypothetical protein